jgi:hypothetical protein
MNEAEIMAGARRHGKSVFRSPLIPPKVLWPLRSANLAAFTSPSLAKKDSYAVFRPSFNPVWVTLTCPEVSAARGFEAKRFRESLFAADPEKVALTPLIAVLTKIARGESLCG